MTTQIKTVRCLNDIMMYCDGTPEPSGKPGYLGVLGCKQDLSKCGHQVGSDKLPGYRANKPAEKPAKGKEGK